MRGSDTLELAQRDKARMFFKVKLTPGVSTFKNTTLNKEGVGIEKTSNRGGGKKKKGMGDHEVSRVLAVRAASKANWYCSSSSK